MSRLIEGVWAGAGVGSVFLRTLLRPAALVFSVVVRLRALAFRLRVRRARRLGAAVVSVGNITVGGTGKTPTALWVAEELRARGYSVAIVSRGYGGTSAGPTIVGAAPVGCVTPATENCGLVGDETLLLWRRLRGPVVAAHDRLAAGRVAEEAFGAEVIVLDDGFQHLDLARDFDLVCVRSGSTRRPLLLPAGPFREPLSALRRADAVLVNKTARGAPGENALGRSLGATPVFCGELCATALTAPDGGAWRELPLGRISARRALVVTGIADRERFYNILHDWEVDAQDFLEFPDHHAYDQEDWQRISRASRDLELVVTTEKDLVKLERFPFARDKLVAVRVVMKVENGERLLDQIESAIAARRQGSAI